MLTEEAKIIVKLRRNKQIKVIGLVLKRFGNCQVGDCIRDTNDERSELFRLRDSYD